MLAASTARAAGDWRAAARDCATVALVALPPLLLSWLLVVAAQEHSLAVDFSHAYLAGARDLLHGRSPYHLDVARTGTSAFIYPPIAGYLFVPFLTMPETAAAILASVLVIAGILGLVRALGVRDWRCYMVALLWWPSFSAIQTANLTLLIAVCTALVWRYRDRRWVPGLLAGLAVALKLFMWPLLVFLLLTRRARAAAAGTAVAVAGIVVPWAAIGFAGLREYPGLVDHLSRLQGPRSHTPVGFAALTFGWTTARILELALAIALVALVHRARREDRTAFLVAVLASLLLNPVLALYYFIFLIVPLAISRARLVWWTLPLVFWVAPVVSSATGARTAPLTVLGIGIAAAVFAPALLAGTPSAGRPGDLEAAKSEL